MEPGAEHHLSGSITVGFQDRVQIQMANKMESNVETGLRVCERDSGDRCQDVRGGASKSYSVCIAKPDEAYGNFTHTHKLPTLNFKPLAQAPRPPPPPSRLQIFYIMATWPPSLNFKP